MDRELEVIRDEMEQTRANLADKLGALETQVRETVSTASETVTSTVEGVKDVVETVTETVGDVTETLNFSKHIEENPWIAMGIALAAGFVVGQVFGGSSQPQPAPAPPPPPPAPEPPRQFEQPRHVEPARPSHSQEEGILGQLGSALPSLESMIPDIKGVGETMVTGLAGLAVGSVMGVVRELVAENLPSDWKGEVNNLVDQVTRQLGGKPQPPRDHTREEAHPEHNPAGSQEGPKQDDKPQGASQPDGARRAARNQPALQS